MAFGDEDVAVGGDGDVAGLIEETRRVARNAGFAKRHKDFAFGTEFENLLALAIFALLVRNPEIALGINRRAVRKDEHAFAPRFEQLAGCIEFEDGRFATAGAGVVVAAVDDINAAVGRDFHRCGRGPGTPPGGFAQSRTVTLYPPSGRSPLAESRGWSPAFATKAVATAAITIAARMKIRERNIGRLSLPCVAATICRRARYSR
jgi:hypothetical protein